MQTGKEETSDECIDDCAHLVDSESFMYHKKTLMLEVHAARLGAFSSWIKLATREENREKLHDMCHCLFGRESHETKDNIAPHHYRG